jgi:hypothetical protein
MFKSSASAPGPHDESAPLPFTGFDRLDTTEVISTLSDHSQAELTAVETYERANQNRKPVLDKLRFMRQPEPLSGYDALTPEEVVAALGDADLITLKKVRGYERKFANRPQVSESVVHALHERRAKEPVAAPRAYAPASANKSKADPTTPKNH